MKKNGNSNGRFAIMRDLQDHLIAGRINFFDLGIYNAIQWQVDFSTGVWWGSAPKLHATGPSGFSLRYVQRSLEKLAAIGFLKPFHNQGQRGNYPVLVNKYEPLSGALRNFRLNASKSTDWRRPVYESCAVLDTVRDTEQPPIHNAVSTNQYKEKKHYAANSAPQRVLKIPAEIETKEAAFGVFWEQWPKKQQKVAALRAWMKIPISEYAAITSGLEKWQKSDQWARRIIPHAATWLNQKRWQDEDVPQKGIGNGNRNAAAVRAEPSKYANIKPIRAVASA